MVGPLGSDFVLLNKDPGAEGTAGSGKVRRGWNGKPAGRSTAATSARPERVSQPFEKFTIGGLELRIFDDTASLNTQVAQDLTRTFEQEATVILPADSTHGNEPKKTPGRIYQKTNQNFKSGRNTLNPKLRITHMDELNFSDPLPDGTPQEKGFADSLRGWLPDVVGTLEKQKRFHALDPTNIPAYDKFVDAEKKNLVIFGGVGAEVPPHLAYINEDLQGIHDETKLLQLRDEEAKRRGVKTAATMGMGLFKRDATKLVEITAKGGHKKDSVYYAFNEALRGEQGRGQSAFGQLIKAYAEGNGKGKLVVNLDAAAAEKLQSTQVLWKKVQRLSNN